MFIGARHVLLLSLVAAGVSVVSLSRPAASKGVLVLGATGEWVAEKTAGEWASHRDKSLPQIEFLKPDGAVPGMCAAGTGGSLALKFDDDPNVYSFPCDTLDDGSCHLAGFPIRNLPGGKAFVCVRQLAPKAPGRGASFWDAVGPLLQESAELFISPVSRGLDPELNDSVALLQGGKLDLSEALRDLAAGTYQVGIESLPTRQASAAGKTLLSGTVRWKEGGKAWIDVPQGFRPALYKAIELPAGRNSEGTRAWILVADEQHFAGLNAEFAKARESVAHWPDTVDARAARTVLRAYLEALSGQK